jgi:hypothetical protein
MGQKSHTWAPLIKQTDHYFFHHQMKKRHGFEEQGVPPLLEECDVVLEGRPFDSNISAETFYYKVGVYCFRIQIQPSVSRDGIKTRRLG